MAIRNDDPAGMEAERRERFREPRRAKFRNTVAPKFSTFAIFAEMNVTVARIYGWLTLFNVLRWGSGRPRLIFWT